MKIKNKNIGLYKSIANYAFTANYIEFKIVKIGPNYF